MGSSITVKTEDPKGWVFIEDNSFPTSLGGIRLVKDADERETRLLAEAMSKKLHTYWLAISGAKGVVASDDIQDFYKFISNKKIIDLIDGKDHQFITGPDMGTSEIEYYHALELANLSHLIRPGLLSKPSKYFELPLDNVLTAYGVIIAIEELVKMLDQSTSFSPYSDEDPLVDKEFVIEGFGKVGTGLALLLKGRAKLVGISTKFGSVYNEDGFDIDELIELQNKHGDHLLEHLDLDIQATDELFGFKCDVIIPGARTEVISANIAQKLLTHRPMIVPVSNAPYTKEGLDILEKNGIYCFPDFVASAGAIIAAMIEFSGLHKYATMDYDAEDMAMDLISAAISFETRDLLMESVACTDGKRTLSVIAEDRSQRNYNWLISQLENPKSIKQMALELISRYNPGLLNMIK